MGLARIDQVKYKKWILPIVQIIAHIIQALKQRPGSSQNYVQQFWLFYYSGILED